MILLVLLERRNAVVSARLDRLDGVSDFLKATPSHSQLIPSLNFTPSNHKLLSASLDNQ